MNTITLTTPTTINQGSTTKYWRTVECQPQTAELRTWSSNHPLFTLAGKIVESHDPSEVGQAHNVSVQTYSFFLQPLIDNGQYRINQ